MNEQEVKEIVFEMLNYFVEQISSDTIREELENAINRMNAGD